MIVGMIVAVVIATVWRFRKPLCYVGLTLAGRNPLCTVRQVAVAPSHWDVAINATKRVREQLRRVEVDPEGYELWGTPRGQYWAPQSSDFLAFVLAEQDRRGYGAGLQAVRRGDIVLDCGAHIGVFTRTALNLGAQVVIAIEPGPENLVCLHRNFKGEIDAGRVVVVPKGVLDREGDLAFQHHRTNPAANAFLLNHKPSTTGDPLPRVAVTRIDTLVTNLRLPRVDFIKMDIEGSERYALAGAGATLGKYRPRLAIASYHRPDDPEAIPAIVKQANGAYQMECGACELKRPNWRLRPDVLFFR